MRVFKIKNSCCVEEFLFVYLKSLTPAFKTVFLGRKIHKGGKSSPKFHVGGGVTRNPDIFCICLIKQKFLVW